MVLKLGRMLLIWLCWLKGNCVSFLRRCVHVLIFPNTNVTELSPATDYSALESCLTRERICHVV